MCHDYALSGYGVIPTKDYVGKTAETMWNLSADQITCVVLTRRGAAPNVTDNTDESERVCQLSTLWVRS